MACPASRLPFLQLFPFCRPGLSLWQAPPPPPPTSPYSFSRTLPALRVIGLSLSSLIHFPPSHIIRPGLSLWQVPPLTFSLPHLHQFTPLHRSSLILTDPHRSSHFPTLIHHPIILPNPQPLSLSHRPGLSLWQVPPPTLFLPHLRKFTPLRRSSQFLTNPHRSLTDTHRSSHFLTHICHPSILPAPHKTSIPLSPTYRPGLSLWQVPPFLLPSLLQARLAIVAGPRGGGSVH